ncbi:hypothetical protein CLIB1423_19S01310 [[Candida] railenensis]|uniref:50S ribosomal protein L35 n=1 Tax=[Candida] railenensis TaxID=45579 RepID=A0A9P0QUL6_9ASCO|nr:hypothetical protein CLIB1423_19S01310 [[Candida] railenensis]
MFGSIVSTLKVAFIRQQAMASPMMQVRNKMKSHKGAVKRFIITGTGIKRKSASRNHGNGGWSQRTLGGLDGFSKVTTKGGHLAKLTKKQLATRI